MTPLQIVTANSYNLLYVASIVAAAAVMRAEGRRRGWDSDTWGLAIIGWAAAGVAGAIVPGLLLGDLVAARTCIGAVAAATIALAVAARTLRIPVRAALDTT